MTRNPDAQTMTAAATMTKAERRETISDLRDAVEEIDSELEGALEEMGSDNHWTRKSG